MTLASCVCVTCPCVFVTFQYGVSDQECYLIVSLPEHFANFKTFNKVLRISCQIRGAQWLSGRVLDSRPRGRGLSLTGVTAFWSLSKTHLS